MSIRIPRHCRHLDHTERSTNGAQFDPVQAYPLRTNKGTTKNVLLTSWSEVSKSGSDSGVPFQRCSNENEV